MARNISVLSAGETVRYQTTGADELIKALHNIADNVPRELANATMDGAELIRNEARVLAPGDGIEAEFKKRTANRVVVWIGPDKSHFYYLFFETGARPHEINQENRQALKLAGGDFVEYVEKHPGLIARPFLRPATDRMENAAVDAIFLRLWRVVQRYCEVP